MALETIELPVQGMTCGGCVRTVERKLGATAGVVSVAVNLAEARATVTFDPAVTGRALLVKALVAAIQQVGFQSA